MENNTKSPAIILALDLFFFSLTICFHLVLGYELYLDWLNS